MLTRKQYIIYSLGWEIKMEQKGLSLRSYLHYTANARSLYGFGCFGYVLYLYKKDCLTLS